MLPPKSAELLTTCHAHAKCLGEIILIEICGGDEVPVTLKLRPETSRDGDTYSLLHNKRLDWRHKGTKAQSTPCTGPGGADFTSELDKAKMKAFRGRFQLIVNL